MLSTKRILPSEGRHRRQPHMRRSRVGSGKPALTKLLLDVADPTVGRPDKREKGALRQALESSPVAVRGTCCASTAGLTHKELSYRVYFPGRGAPTARVGVLLQECAVISGIHVPVVQHELPDDLHLFAPLAVQAGHRPFRIAGMRRHFHDNAGLLGDARILWIMLRILPNLLGDARIEADAKMKVK